MFFRGIFCTKKSMYTMKNMIYGPERKLIHNQGYMFSMSYLNMLFRGI